MKQAEIGSGLSGVLGMVMFVVFALQGMGLPITFGNVLLGLMLLVGASISIGGGIFIVLVVCFGLLRKEANKGEIVEEYYY
jgi:hypothetical protein